MEEIPLPGGDVTVGVVRVGDTVRRPRGPEAPQVEALLRHLEAVGFDGAPRFLGIDERGRQVLTFVEGEVAGRPAPEWVADEERIVSVARLVRRYDDAAMSFGPQLVGHMDITPENVVFRDGRAAALIDFDLCRPTDRVHEVANMLLWWAPLMPAGDRSAPLVEVDAVARAALLVDAYGLDASGRAQLVPVLIDVAHRSWFSMKDRAERLGGGWARMWDEGVGDQILRRQVWLREHASALTAAVSDALNAPT